MTLEEIINVDWTEQTDLTKYVKYFEDQQLLREQLTYFTYQYLRTKLISWEELKEEGLENVNLFNFGYAPIHIQGKLYRIAYPVYKRFIRIDLRYIINVEPYNVVKEHYPIDSTDSLFERCRKHLDIVLENAREIYKRLGAPSEYTEAIVLVSLLTTGYYKGTLIENDIVEKLSVNPYIEFLDREPRLSCVFSRYENIIPIKDVIELGLQQKFSDLLKNIKIDLESDYKNTYLNHYFGKPKPDALYYINDLGQPIFVALESKFNKDYISTEIDIKNNRVKFNFRTYGCYWREEDNSLVYQGRRYADYVEVDLTEDKIIDHYE